MEEEEKLMIAEQKLEGNYAKVSEMDNSGKGVN